SFTLDTIAPTAAATVTALSADTGSSGTDFVTSTASQTISGSYTGTLGSGETIQVSADGGTTWLTASAGSGTFSASGVTLSSGTNTLSVRTIDTAGNTTAGTGPSYTLDQTSPAAPSLNTYVQGTHVLTGSTEAGALITAKDGSTTIGTGTADGSGSFSISLSSWSGNKTISATATDAAGNVSSASTFKSIWPAGVAGSDIDLGLTNLPTSVRAATTTIYGVPSS